MREAWEVLPVDPELPNHDPVAEEIAEVGLDPSEVDEDLYLAVRARLVSGDLEPAEMADEVQRLMAIRRAEDDE